MWISYMAFEHGIQWLLKMLFQNKSLLHVCNKVIYFYVKNNLYLFQLTHNSYCFIRYIFPGINLTYSGYKLSSADYN